MEANDDILDELEMQKEPKVEVEWAGNEVEASIERAYRR